MVDAGRAPSVVLVTGISGLIGRRVAGALQPDYRVVGLDVERPAAGVMDHVFFVECDLTRDADTAQALDTVRTRFGPHLASVIHLAAYYDFSGAPSPLYEELTVEGTRRLLRGLRQRFELEQFVFSSSLLVMEPVEEGEILEEASPVAAEWDYPASKLEAEAAIREEHGDVPVVILRLAGAYDEGGHSPPLTQQIWRIREKKFESFVFPGDRSHGQSFVHLDDVARCFRVVVDRRRELEPYEVFLIGEPEVLSYAALQDRIGCLLHGREWPTVRIPAPIAKAGAWVKEKALGDEHEFIKPWMIDLADAHYPVSIRRARERLGWEPHERLADVLPRMIQTLERDPRRWYEENELPLDEERDQDDSRRG